MQQPMRNPFIPIFAAVALLLHTLLPFYATYQSFQHLKNTDTLFGDKILICAENGFRFISSEELKNGKVELPKPHRQYQCAICYVAAHGQGIVPLPSVGIATVLLVVAPFFLITSDVSFFAEHDWRKLLTRSPPYAFTGS